MRAVRPIAPGHPVLRRLKHVRLVAFTAWCAASGWLRAFVGACMGASLSCPRVATGMAAGMVIGVAIGMVMCAVASVATGVEPTQEPSKALSTQPAQEPAKAPAKVSAKHLPNPVSVHPRVISGGLPEGDAAFAELRTLGVRTIVSVDGAEPDVAAAARHGLKYVHLPHGYDGIPDRRVRELAKAVRELEGPIYIHCHLGKHRSPAAASAACVTAGLLPPAEALAVLKVAGTNPKYRGLFQAVAKARPIPGDELHRLAVTFRERVEVAPLVKAMVALESTHERLKAASTSGWKRAAAPAPHADPNDGARDGTPVEDPAHQAVLLGEHFAEMRRLQEVQAFPAEFSTMLGESQAFAERIERELPRWPALPGQAVREGLDRHLREINDRCVRCHERYRDTR